MKKILIFLIISLCTLATPKLSISYSIYTDHSYSGEYSYDYDFQENNNLICIEYEKYNNLYSVASFENSFYKNSISVNYRHRFFSKHKLTVLLGASLIYGYDEINYLKSKSNDDKVWVFENPTYIGQGFTLSPTLSFEYMVNSKISIEETMVGNAFITSIKYYFDYEDVRDEIQNNQ